MIMSAWYIQKYKVHVQSKWSLEQYKQKTIYVLMDILNDQTCKVNRIITE